MQSRRVTEDLAVAPQIRVEDVAAAAEQGFKAIVCNRPDGESFDQTAFEDIARAARAAGLEITWQPVTSGAVTDEDGQRFGEIVAGLDGPVLAYCRTGTRCIILWALSEAGKLTTGDIIAKAQAAGYDLSQLAPRLDQLAAARNG